MLPVATITASYTPPATLVATTIPDTNTQRVQPDVVAPAVSVVQVDQNNPSPAVQTAAVQTQTAEQAASADADATTASANTSPAAGSSTQAAFLAQLVSQEIPPVLRDAYQTVLAQYEETVANSFVKYKPSNAGIPPLTPATSFQEALEPEPAPVQAPAPVVQQQAVTAVTQTAPAATPRSISISTSPLQTNRGGSPVPSGTTQQDSSAYTLPAPAAISAYTAAAARSSLTK